MTERSFIFVSSSGRVMTKAESTRQFIIEKAAPIFNVKGVAATAMSDIMEATKLSKGSLYVHFENKEELSYCAVDYTFDKFMLKISAAITPSQTQKGKLLALLNFLTDPLHPPVTGGCPIMNFGMEADDTNPVILEKVDKAVKGIQQLIVSLVKQGIAEGEFKADCDPKEFSIKAFAMIEGGILVSRINGNRSQMAVIVNILKKEIEEMSS